jgi:carboxymethylenebutenolidase
MARRNPPPEPSMQKSSNPMPGFAPAAGAPGANVIRTGTEGLEAGLVSLPAPDGPLPVYFAKPKGGSNLPVVLIAQEIFGLHEHIRDIARRFAKLGYAAIAPDYFHRRGDPLGAPDIAAIRVIVNATPDREIMRDFDAALAFAGENGGDVARAAITGFCWGGRIAWLYAAHNPRLRACAPWYGRLDGDHTDNQPRWPIDVAARLRVPALGLYGGDDPSIPADLVDSMRARLRGAGARAEIVVYPGAPHAFFADYRESYRETAATDAWTRALAFLKENGVG